MPNNTPLILAIDIGTSSVRCSLWTADGSPIPDSQAQQKLQFEGNGQTDPETLQRATEDTLDQCLAQYAAMDQPGSIVGVGWASFAMSWLGVDTAGTPVTPVYTYADTLSGRYARYLRARLDEVGEFDATYRRTGTPIHTAYAPAQLLRLADEEPERLARVSTWQTIAAHLLAQWTGQPVQPISSSEAGWTGLLNRSTDSWDEALLGWLPIGLENLPPLYDYAQGICGLSQAYVDRWPALAEVPFFLAVGDGAAANIGTNCTNSKRLALTIGTSGATRVVVHVEDHDTIDVPPGLWVYPVDRHRRLLGGSLTDGGSLYSWLRNTLVKESKEELLAEAAALKPDAHGLTVLPFLRSERSPGWATDARLTISGISAETTPAHLLRAGLEAVAYRFRLIADKLAPFLEDQTEIYASGGALHSAPHWRQILADVLQRPVHLTEIDEATSRGVALLVAQALGLLDNELPKPPIVHTSYPNVEAGKIYYAAVHRQQELYAKILGGNALFKE
jgi:gluconokinase